MNMKYLPIYQKHNYDSIYIQRCTLWGGVKKVAWAMLRWKILLFTCLPQAMIALCSIVLFSHLNESEKAPIACFIFTQQWFLFVFINRNCNSIKNECVDAKLQSKESKAVVHYKNTSSEWGNTQTTCSTLTFYWLAVNF
jgi:hypothetical protein